MTAVSDINWRITMTSLFSHSLLINTYRDVQGAYEVFSRGTAHTPLPSEGDIDRSSANVSSPRENYSVVAKEMAKFLNLN